MVEIIPRPKPKIPFWQNILLWLAIALFIASILSYFISDSSQKKASQNLQDLEALLAKEKTVKEITSLEKEIFGCQKKIEDFFKILNSHQLSSNLFKFIESQTHPKVRWLSFNLKTQTLTVSLSGQTQNFQTLNQQISILKKEGLINEINLSNIKLGEGGEISFDLNFSFDQKILK
jgi:hypothetical protein